MFTSDKTTFKGTRINQLTKRIYVTSGQMNLHVIASPVNKEKVCEELDYLKYLISELEKEMKEKMPEEFSQEKEEGLNIG